MAATVLPSEVSNLSKLTLSHALEAAAADKHVAQSSELNRQKAGSLGFEGNRRPEALSLDLDFAENGPLEEARKVQSEHWSTDSYTLFIEVAQFLDVGAEVTVDGEAEGEARAAGSHWARVRHALQRRGLHGCRAVERAPC